LIFIDTGARPKQLTLKVSRTVQARMMLNDRDLAAETAKNLSELQPNIAATND